MRKIMLFGLLMGLALLLSACDSTPVLTEADNGGSLELQNGETFRIRLEGNITTGYSWEARPDAAGVVALQGEPEYTSEGGGTGAGGVFEFTFQALQPGETMLELVYRRPWEADVAPIETFVVKVTVVGGE